MTGNTVERPGRSRSTGYRTTDRDRWLARSLYTALALTTEDIARLHFPSQAYLDDRGTDRPRYSEGAAKVRLYKLLAKGVVRNDHFTPIGASEQVTYWFLPPKQYRQQAYAAGRRDERYPPIPERLTHHFKVTAIYSRIKPGLDGLFERLDGYEYPEWRWENERHSHCEYFSEGAQKRHQPDAEIHMPDGQVCFLERQTKESKESRNVVHDKVLEVGNYARYRGYSTEQTRLLFACDTDRDREYAREALQKSSIKGVLGDSDTIVRYLLTRAEEIVASAGEDARARV